MQSKMICLLGLVLAGLFLAGCVGLSSPSINERVYFTQKIGTALTTDENIKTINILNVNGKRIAIISLRTVPGKEENACLNAMRALSRDPLVPLTDEVCIAVDQARSISVQGQLGIAVAQGVAHGLTAGILGGGGTPTEEEVLTFSCKSTRDALLKGEDPEVTVRDAIFVSDPYKGQRTDSWWLHENKSKPVANPEMPSTNQNGLLRQETTGVMSPQTTK